MKFKEGDVVEHKVFGEGRINIVDKSDTKLPYQIYFKVENRNAWLNEEDIFLKVPEFLKEKIEIIEVNI